MKKSLKLLMSFLPATAVSLNLWAAPTASTSANTTSTASQNQNIEKILQRTQALEDEIKLLKAQLRQIKQQQKVPASTAIKRVHHASLPAPVMASPQMMPAHYSTNANPSSSANGKMPANKADRPTHSYASVADAASSSTTIAPSGGAISGSAVAGAMNVSTPPGYATDSGTVDIATFSSEPIFTGHNVQGFMVEDPATGHKTFVPSHYFDGAPVVISPFIGLRSEFDSNDLVVNITDINTDLRLLRQRAQLKQVREKYGIPPSQHPLLELSGLVEGQALAYNPYHGGTRGDINLASAELDAAAQVGQWANGFMSINYDDSATAPIRNTNSRFFLQRGFLTIGDLTQSPYYFTIGLMYVPTGMYDSNMLSTVLTRTISRVRARSILVGFEQAGTTGWNGQLYAYKGDSDAGHSRQGGAHIEQRLKFNNGSAAWGMAYNSSMADAEGQQDTGLDTFEGFGASSESEKLVHRVPSLDIHGGINIGQYDFLGEFVTATTNFSKQDLIYGDKGAQPRALNLEANYRFKWLGYNSSFAVGYGQSWQSLALNVPKNRYSATFNTSFWKGTIESIEFRHDVNYSSSTTAGGRDSDGSIVYVSPQGLGHTSDTLTAQIGIYF